MHMSCEPAPVRRRLLLAAAACLTLAGVACAQPAPTASVAIPPIPPGEARIWIYRAYQPSESLNMTEVMINGVNVGYAQASGGAFYRDVPPGHYHIAAQSYGTDVNQTANIDLAAGQEAYVKIESLRSWASYGDRNEIGRDTFYARLIPPQLARAEIANSPFLGGG
jgi:hypothetical protein